MNTKGKRSYSEIVASIETHIIYINNHLANVDSHLEKINTTNLKQEVKIAKNKDRITLGYKIGGGILSIILTGLLALGLHLIGIY